MACSQFGSDLGQVIAISTAVPDSLEEYDTLTPQAVALNGAGDPVPATILWASLDTVLTVLDDATGRTVVSHPGLMGRLEARVGTLPSNPLSIRALAAADTLFATGPVVDTVTLSDATPPDSLSTSLSVELADTVTTPSPALVPLVGRPVVYAITYPPAPGMGSVTLVTDDTARALVTVDTVKTNGLGVASMKVRLLADALPDSIVVTASARRAVGTPVPDSVTFVVRFQP